MRKAWIIRGCISTFIAGLAIIAFTIFPFAWELTKEAANLTIHSTYGTTFWAIFRDIAVVAYVAIKVGKRRGSEAVRKYLRDGADLAEALVIAFVLTFVYHLAITVPDGINTEASLVNAPFLETIKRLAPTLKPPQIHPKSVPQPQAPKPQTPIWNDKSPEPTSLDALFLQDFPTTMRGHDESIGIQWKDTGAILHIKRQLYLDLSAKERFVGFYIPSSGPDLTRTPEVCARLFKENAVQQAIIDLSKVQIFFFGMNRSSGSFPFSKKVLIYQRSSQNSLPPQAIV